VEAVNRSLGVVIGITLASLTWAVVAAHGIRRPIPLPAGDPTKLERIMAAPLPDAPVEYPAYFVHSSGAEPGIEPPAPRVHRHARVTVGRNGAPIIP